MADIKVVFEGELDYVLALKILRVKCSIVLKDGAPFMEVTYANAAPNSPPSISVPLDDNTTIFRSHNERCDFEMTYNKVKNYLFRASNEEERSNWIEKLGCHVNEFDIFLSYHQCKATQDTVMALHQSFEQLGYETFFDKIIEDLNVEKMENGVKMTRAYLLYLSPGVFARDAVKLECKTAVQANKPIITVYDRDGDFSFEKERTSDVYKKFLKEINGNRENPIDILNDVESEVLERMPKKRQVMINSLLARAGLPDKGVKLTDMEDEHVNPLEPPALSSNYATGIHKADHEKVVDWLCGNVKTSREVSLGLSGMDGVGKSWFVQSVVWDNRVTKKFTDGIYWLTFSYQDDAHVDDVLKIKQAELAKSILKRKFFDLGDPDKAAAELAKLLEKRNALIILDNVASTKILERFDIVSNVPKGSDVLTKTIVTVRDMSLTERRQGFWNLRLKSELPDDEALRILEQSSGRKYNKADNQGDQDANLHAYAIQIIKRCRNHPMSVGIAGKLINAYGGEVALLEKLIQVNNVYNLADAKTSVNSLMTASLDNLPKELKKAYWDLAIFAKGYKFTANDAALIWRSNPGVPATLSAKITGRGLKSIPDAEFIAKKLVDLSLVSVEDVAAEEFAQSSKNLNTMRKEKIPSIKVYSIHDMQMTYVRNEEERKKNGEPTLKKLHKLFVKNIYEACDGKPWAIDPTFHTYVLTRLSSHLTLAGEVDLLKALVFSYDWLQSKITDENWDTTVTYIDDVRRLNELFAKANDKMNETACTWLLRTINLSIGILNRHPTNAALAEQLWNRLYPIVSKSSGITGDCMDLLKDMVSRSEEERMGEMGLQPMVPALATPEYSLLQSLSGHRDSVRICRTFQKQNYNTQIISASWDKTIRVWDVENGKCNQILGGENSSVSHSREVLAIVMYEPTVVDTYIVSGSMDGQVIFWNADDGSVKRVLKVEHGVTSLAVNYNYEDRHNLIVATADGIISIYDIKNLFAQKSKKSEAVKVKPVFTVDDDEGMKIYTVAFYTPGNPRDGPPLILYGGNRNDMKAYDTKTRKIMHFRGHKSSVNRICLYESKGWAVTCSTDCTIKVWKIKNRRCVKSLGIMSKEELEDEGTTEADKSKDLMGHNQSVRDITLHTDSERPDDPILVSVSKDRVVIIWDLNSGQLLSKLFGHSNSIYTCCACKTSRGSVVITGSEDRMLKVWEMGIDGAKGWDQDSTNKTREHAFGDTFDHFTHSVYAVKTSPDGKLIVTGTAEGRVRIIDRESTKVLETLKDKDRNFHADRVRSVDIIEKIQGNPNVLLIVSASKDKTIKTWEYTASASEGRGRILATLKGHEDEVRTAVFRTDTKQPIIYSGSRDKKIMKWTGWESTLNETKPTVFGEHDDTVFSIALHTQSPKHKFLVSSSYDHSAKVWDLEKETCLKVLSGHEGPVRTVAIANCSSVSKSPIIFTGSVDTTIKVWDYSKKIPLIDTLRSRTGAIRAIDVVSDGEASVFVAVGSEDRNVKVWELELCKKLPSSNGLKGSKKKQQQRRSMTNNLDVDVKFVYSLSETLGRIDHPLYCGSVHAVETFKDENDEICILVGASAGGIPQLRLSLG